ncbi:biotin--[acetyl-CoA-carboxylase] ligase, partial [Clostridium perfringens]|nr:biotin--[acetyl-CoA-carboxylase] ligase [Clostridium perfringens]
VRTPKEGFAEEIKDIATGIFEYETSASSDIRSKLIAEILERFWNYYKHIEDKSFLKSYKERSLLINKEVNILSSKSSERAVVLEIDDECRLKVKMEDGSIRLLSSGEVSVRV